MYRTGGRDRRTVDRRMRSPLVHTIEIDHYGRHARPVPCVKLLSCSGEWKSVGFTLRDDPRSDRPRHDRCATKPCPNAGSFGLAVQLGACIWTRTDPGAGFFNFFRSPLGSPHSPVSLAVGCVLQRASSPIHSPSPKPLSPLWLSSDWPAGATLPRMWNPHRTTQRILT